MDPREVLRQKLQQKIKAKRCNIPSPKDINKLKKEYKKEVNGLKNDSRITEDMLSKYRSAITDFPDTKIGNPKQILDDPEKYKKEYGKYVFEIIKMAKEKKWGITTIKTMLQNSYTSYITYVLGIDNLPEFIKT